jgi:hypothetical protein
MAPLTYPLVLSSIYQDDACNCNPHDFVTVGTDPLQILCTKCLLACSVCQNPPNLHGSCVSSILNGLHHFHPGKAVALSWSCCQCSMQLDLLPLECAFRQLKPEFSQQNSKEAQQQCLSMIEQYARNALNGSSKPIRLVNAHFASKIGSCHLGKEILCSSGFTQVEGFLIPPNLKGSNFHLETFLFFIGILRNLLADPQKHPPSWPALLCLLGAPDSSTTLELQVPAAYKTLGVSPVLSDTQLASVFELLLAETPSAIDDLASHFKEIASERQSNFLTLKLIQLTRQGGSISFFRLLFGLRFERGLQHSWLQLEPYRRENC